MIIKSFENTKEKVHSRDIEIDSFEKEDPILITPRKNQIEIMEKHYNSKYFQLIQPPGSGKSITISYVMSKRLIEDPNLKLIISVPKTIIAKSFGRMILNHNNKYVEWGCFHNLCDDVNFSKIKYLINFLQNKQKTNDIKSRIALTTHMSFARAVEKIQDINNIFDNTIVVFDEAHRVMYEDNETSNKIGNFIKTIFENKVNTGIWLATATPYRSDNNNMIPKEILNKFDKHFLPLDKHWDDNIKYIESFAFNFVIYKQNEILNEVKEVFKLGKKKSIIFCPYVGHLLKDIDKIIFKKNIIDHIKEVWPECRILDLVEINGRNKRKEILQNNKDAKNIDVILTCKIFDEGSDWIYAEQCLDLAPSNFLGVMYQRFGRLWRDYVLKNVITYYCFLPFEAKFKSEDDRRLHLSKSFNALAASLLLQDIILPIKYPTTLKGQHKEKEEHVNPLHNAIPDEDKRSVFLEKVIKKLLVMKSVSENPTSQDVKQWIKCALTSENIVEDQDDIINYIGLIFRRRTNLKKQPDWSNAFDINKLIKGGFDKIWVDEIFENLRVFGTNVCTAETFKEFREIINGDRHSVDEWSEYLNIVKDPITNIISKSKLPTACRRIVDKYPEEFLGFKFEIESKSPDKWKEWLKTKINLETGLVPIKSTLPNGCKNAIVKYPEKFREFEFETNIIKLLNYWKEWIKLKTDLGTMLIPIKKSSLPKSCQYYIYKYPEEFGKFEFEMQRQPNNFWGSFLNNLKDPITNLYPTKSSLPKSCQNYIYNHPEEFGKFEFKNGYKKRRNKSCQQE